MKPGQPFASLYQPFNHNQVTLKVHFNRPSTCRATHVGLLGRGKSQSCCRTLFQVQETRAQTLSLSCCHQDDAIEDLLISNNYRLVAGISYTLPVL